MFGPFGIGWGVGEERFEFKELRDTTLLLYTAKMFFEWDSRIGSINIASSIKAAYPKADGSRFIVDDECMKKAQTDALTKGLSFLGFNADVFLGKFDDNKYVESVKKEFTQNRKFESYHKKFESYYKLINDEDPIGLYLFLKSLSEEEKIELHNSFERGKKTSGKALASDLETDGFTYLQKLEEHMALDDSLGAAEIVNELSPLGRLFLSQYLGDARSKQLGELIKGTQ
jgi:hypothetical protein